MTGSRSARPPPHASGTVGGQTGIAARQARPGRDPLGGIGRRARRAVAAGGKGTRGDGRAVEGEDDNPETRNPTRPRPGGGHGQGG